MTDRAAVYARISSDDLRDGLGVERQLDDLRRYCKREGWSSTEYVDNDLGASTYSRRARPEFGRMLAAVKAGRHDVVLVMELSRFTRDPAVVEGLIRAQDKGVRLVSVQGGEYDPESATGKLRLRTEAMVAASYSDFVSDKVKRKKVELVETGFGPGGSRAFGYRGADPGVGRRAGTEIDRKEAAAYRKAVDDVLAGATLTSIAHRWNDAGFRTPRTQSLWGVPSVRATLTNPRHAGLLARSVTRDGRKTYEVIGEAKWPPIITRDQHDRLVRLLNDPDRRRKNPPRRGLLTTFLRCGRCGSTLRSDSRSYVCRRQPETAACGRNNIPIGPLEELIDAAVLYRIQSTAVRKALAKPKPRRRRGEDPDKLQQELDELSDLTSRGDLTMREFLTLRKGYEERIAKADAEPANGDRPNARALLKAADIPKAWRRLDVDRKRAIIAELIDRIDITPNEPGEKSPLVDRVTPLWRV